MANDAFVIYELPSSAPKPDTKPRPLIVEELGRAFADLSPAQKARTTRSQIGPFFFEPAYNANGSTGRWRVGRELGSSEQTIGECDNKTEAMSCFTRYVNEFFSQS
jgi:hypothetical protein